MPAPSQNHLRHRHEDPDGYTNLQSLSKVLGVVKEYSGTYEWVVPKELIKNWNDAVNNVESALLDAINTYIPLQVHHGERLGNAIVDVVKAMQKEMQRRMALEPQQRAQEEWKSSSLYNNFYNKLADSIKQLAPPKLKSSAHYAENLDIFAVLIEVLVKDGDLQASISKDEGTD
ncbi:hypothetical protein J3F83DRAFT_340217 [Trichoderma novae-zelandiae]